MFKSLLNPHIILQSFPVGMTEDTIVKIRKHSLPCSLSTRNEGNPLLQIEVEPTSDVSFQLIPSFPFVFVYNGASRPGPDT